MASPVPQDSCPCSVKGKVKSVAEQISPRKSPRKRVLVDQYVTVLLDALELSSPKAKDSQHQNGHLTNPESEEKPRARRQLDINGLSSDLQPVTLSQETSSKKTKGRIYCDICRVYCNSEVCMLQHKAGRRHRIHSFNKDWDVLKENREGIEVTCLNAALPDALSISVEFESSKRMRDINFRIKNRGISDVHFNCLEIVDPKCATRRHFNDFQEVGKKVKKRSLAPNSELALSLRLSKKALGFYCTKVAFIFSKPKMAIVRDLEVDVITDVMKELGPRSPYKRPPRVSEKLPPFRTIDGLRPVWDKSKDKLERTVALEQYYIPSAVRCALNHGLQDMESDNPKEKSCDIRNLLMSSLEKTNYSRRFMLLLHIEEAQMEVDIRKYDLSEVELGVCKTNHTLLTLDVPGLLEKRPSVLVGDHLLLRPLKSDKTPEGTEYKAYVHATCLNQVELGLSQQLRNSLVGKMKFNCRFNFNRLPLKLQHRAVQLADENSLYNFLFPDARNICQFDCIQPVDTPMKFYNRLVEENEQQSLAVRHIVAGSSRPAPFLIFGPPGTGKTVTMVEAMKQVLKCIPLSRILTCAPSNNAADLLTDRLLEHIPRKSILRMNAASRDWAQVPQKIRDCCNYESRGYFYPPLSDLLEFKVVVTTLVTAGRLVSANFPPGHFTHIFIDEAGQSVEPEAIIPIAGIFESAVARPEGGQVVLAGDPEQLGPVLRSPVAITYGLGMSLLERYMKTVAVYLRKPQASSASEAYDPRLLVKLVRNYRSHPDILKVPNESFYVNELEACADRLARESLCQWSGLPKLGLPMIFHGVVGKDEREERSPSFFNTAEVAVVLEYVDKLLETRQNRIQAKEIGILSPYRKQVQKFHQVLKDNKYKDIAIGTVEEFQGQERKVIFISTVRSNTEFLPSDYQSKLGFLKNPKRFNVAVTRAKALLIIIGNPHILCHDIHWNRLLKFCVDRGVYVGCEFDNPATIDSDIELEECLENLSKLKFSDSKLMMEMEENRGLEISQTMELADPQWRNDI